MSIQELSLSDFRNYKRFELGEIGDLTVFVGKNGVGKTNILEGIQLLTSASSFRHPQISQLVRDGASDGVGRASMEASDGNRRLAVALMLENGRLSGENQAGKRRYSINGKAKKAVDVRGLLPSVVFAPDDLQLVKGSSGIRRSALDDLGMQLTRSYYIVRRDYEKTVRYKNRLLRDEAPQDLVMSINETLVTCGAQLFCLRAALFDRMVPVVSRMYGELAGIDGEVFSAFLRPSWDRGKDDRETRLAMPETGALNFKKPSSRSRDEVRETLSHELDMWFGEESRRRRALVGPHRDEIAFLLDGRDAAVYASQGQQRSIVLAWKLAEVEVARDVLGVTPVLLLDDVLSELDGARRTMLVKSVSPDVQTFVTATDLDGFAPELLERARVVELA